MMLSSSSAICRPDRAPLRCQSNGGTSRRTPARGGTTRGVLTTQPLTVPAANHRYDYALIGAGQPAAFRLFDTDTRDNYGSFEISVRLAVPTDCDGDGYSAFGLPSLERVCCRGQRQRNASIGVRRRAAAIDQAPISRVLRDSDVPAATNLELPSGALDAVQFAVLETPSARAARSASRSLSLHGTHLRGRQRLPRGRTAEPEVDRRSLPLSGGARAGTADRGDARPSPGAEGGTDFACRNPAAGGR